MQCDKRKLCSHGWKQSDCKGCGGSSICSNSSLRHLSQGKECAVRLSCLSLATGGGDRGARSAGGRPSAFTAGGDRSERSTGGRPSAATGTAEGYRGALARSAGVVHLQPLEAAIAVQGVRGVVHLQPQQEAIEVQGVWPVLAPWGVVRVHLSHGRQ